MSETIRLRVRHECGNSAGAFPYHAGRSENVCPPCVGVFTDYPIRDGKIITRNNDSISSIKGEDGDYTCYLLWGGAGHSPFKGLCWDAERCRVVGTYREKVGNIYFVDHWTNAQRLEAPEQTNSNAPTKVLRTTSIPSNAISNPKELLKAVMNEFYGTFSEKNGCWLTKRNDDTDCMKPYKMDIVGSDNNRRLFIVTAGQKLDDDGRPEKYHAASGVLGLIVFSENGSHLDVLASNTFMRTLDRSVALDL